MQAAFEKMRQRAAAKQRLAEEEADRQQQARPVKLCVLCQAVIRDRVASFKNEVGPLCVKCDGTAE